MRKNQKGFTLVELLVVIAILAILATVAVVGYSSFIESANKSVDEQVVAQMNTALQAASVESMPKNRTELLKLFDEHDIDINKLAPVTEGYAFYWDQSENKIVIVKNGNTVENDWEYIVSNEFGNLTEVNSVEGIKSAIENSSNANPALIKLSKDIETTECITVNKGQCVIIDLNGYSLKCENSDLKILEANSGVLTVKNGTINGGILNDQGSLTLDHITIDKKGESKADSYRGALNFRGYSDTYVSNCTLKADGYYSGQTIGTNSSDDKNDGARAYITNSTITHTGTNDYAAINITIDCDITINHCTVTGLGQGAYFRGCTATIIDSKFSHTSTESGTDWGTGNKGKYADIVFACGGTGFGGYATTGNYTCDNVTADTVYVHQPEGGTVNVSGIKVTGTDN